MDDQPSEIRRPQDAEEGERGFAPPRHRLRIAFGLLAGLAVVGLAVWLLPRSAQTPSTGGRRFMTGGPVSVVAAPVKRGEMPVRLHALGTVTPLATVTVRTQISGQLTEIAFHEGQTVEKGQFLAQIDPRPYRVALEQAEAQLAKDRAILNNARSDLARYDRLLKQNSIAAMTRDTQAALVAQDEATVKADQAAVDAQKLNLTYCHIVAPISGRVGLRQVDPGNYVQTSDANGIVVITQMHPISVIFTLPENDLQAVLKRLKTGATLPVAAYDSAGTAELAPGRLETVDNQIDPSTGTVKLRAVFANTAGRLFPNQFVNVRLLVDTLKGVDLVPSAAIQRGAPGTFVYIVEAGGKATIRKVALGPSDGEETVVTGGLKAGEKVVTDGADRLREGSRVRLVGNSGGAGGATKPAGSAPSAAAAPHRRQAAR